MPPPPEWTASTTEWTASTPRSSLYRVSLNGVRATLQSDECQLSFSSSSSRNVNLKEVRRFWWREISHLELCQKNRRLLYLHLLYAVVVLQNPLYPVTVIKFSSARARTAFVSDLSARLEVIRLLEEKEEEGEEGDLDENGNIRRESMSTKTKPKPTILSLCHLICQCLRPTPASNAIYEPVLSKVFYCS